MAGPSVAVVTSVYGGYDQIVPPVAQDVPCEWVAVSDVSSVPEPWRAVTEPRPQLHPRLAAKVAKCCPHWYTDAQIMIWIDGNLQITSSSFIEWCLDALGGAPLAQHHSVERTSIAAEAAEAGTMLKYQGLPVHEQAAHYIKAGHPENYGVWWTGLIVRRRGCPDFGTPWLAEMTRWTYEDQISQPYVLGQAGLRPADIPIEWGSYQRFQLREHRDQS